MIEWHVKDPAGAGAYPNRVKNGFALLTLSDNGLAEAFYNAGDAAKPAWEKPT